MKLARSVLFQLALLVLTPPYSLLALASFPLPRQVRYRIITGWAHIVLLLARFLLGIRYRIEGLENLPAGPAIILSKHQSAWETIAYQVIFPPHSMVLKRELLWIPFFGWGLGLMSPIAIDRSRGIRALKRMAELGKRRIAQGFWIVIYPEGTRTAPSERRSYQIGGAWLGHQLGVPIVPVAHNAGLYWPRNALVKHPGLITVRVGPPIDTSQTKPEALNAKVEAWIEAQMEDLCPK